MNQAKIEPILFVHTPKAQKAGASASRLFVAVQTEKEGRTLYYLAWKTQMVYAGIQHPKTGYQQIHTVAEAVEMSKNWSDSGSEPTAYFHKDSFYRQVSIEEVQAWCDQLDK